MTVGTVTSKGHITIPADVRKALGLRPGSRVDFVSRADGVVELRVAHGSVRSLKGFIQAPDRPVTLEEMDEAIAEGAAEGSATQ
jgi:antitoxin PrlF